MDNEISHIELQGWKPQEFELVFEFGLVNIWLINETFLEKGGLLQAGLKISTSKYNPDNDTRIIKITNSDDDEVYEIELTTKLIKVVYYDLEQTDKLIDVLISSETKGNHKKSSFSGHYHLFHPEAKEKIVRFYNQFENFKFNVIRFAYEDHINATFYACSKATIHLILQVNTVQIEILRTSMQKLGSCLDASHNAVQLIVSKH